jgi:toxin ParE1/3/4
MAIRVQAAASHRIDEIFRYTRERWGPDQASRYIRGLFEAFDRIESRTISSRPIPAEFGVNGFVVRYASHVIYWRALDNGDTGIVTVLHERMHQIDRFREDFGL